MEVNDERYTFEVIDLGITNPGEATVVDPQENEIHAVYSPVRSRSLHVHPSDNWSAFGYVRDEDRPGDRGFASYVIRQTPTVRRETIASDALNRVFVRTTRSI